MVSVDAQFLEGWLVEQRWFASKSRDLNAVNMLETLTLRESEEQPLVLALVEARFATGTHELYQVLLGARQETRELEEGTIAEVEGWEFYDAVGDPEQGGVLAGYFDGGRRIQGTHGWVRFHHTQGSPRMGAHPDVRPMGAEQSNSSVILDDKYVLKVFRRLEAGDNPELEMLRFLTERGFESIARLQGWYDYSGELMDATLGVVQDYVADATDGWDLALTAIGAGDEALIDRLRDLGAVTGDMHRALGSSGTDPDFAPEEPSDDALALLTATIDEQIERVWVDLPQNDSAVEPILHRGQEIRDRLQSMSHVGVGGRQIRHHGDFHLGQTLARPDGGWVILDFEGEPARSLRDRRRKRSPLRDVAGMLRSFAYAASASELLHGKPAPGDWEDRARAAFLEGYYAHVDRALLPAGQTAIDKLLTIFELEKAVYELRYEIDNRPEWVRIPVAGIARLLEEPLPA
jgi:trehalose synthase-fused probable maltokinase